MNIKDRIINKQIQYFTLKLLLIIARRLVYKNFTLGEDRDDTMAIYELSNFITSEYQSGVKK